MTESITQSSAPSGGASPGARRPRPRRLPARILLLASLLSLALGQGAASAASSTGLAPATPAAQLMDRLEKPGEEPVAALYSTELTESGYEMEGVVQRLPCPESSYRFLATDSAVNESQTSSYEADIRVIAAQIPKGLRCGVALSRRLVEGGATIRLTPSTDQAPLATVYRDPQEKIQVESLSTCSTLDELCPGHYVLSASFDASRRPLTVVYEIVVSAATPASGPAPRISAALQCPTL